MADPSHEPEPVGADIDHRLIGRLSIKYMITMIGEVMRARRGDFTDVLIVTTIFSANGEAKRGISRNALSRMLNMPLETVRRRVNALIQKGTLIEQQDGLVFAYGDALVGSDPAIDALNFQQLGQLYRALKAQGVDLN